MFPTEILWDLLGPKRAAYGFHMGKPVLFIMERAGASYRHLFQVIKKLLTIFLFLFKLIKSLIVLVSSKL